MIPPIRIEITASPELLAALDRIAAAFVQLCAATPIRFEIPPIRSEMPASDESVDGRREDARAAASAFVSTPNDQLQARVPPPSAPQACGPERDTSGQPPPAPAKPAGRRMVPLVYTPERNALIRREWTAGTPLSAIVDAVNALPGPPTTATRVGVQAAGVLGLKRPGRSRAAAKPVPVPPPATAPLDPIETDHETALRWGAERGCDPHNLDLSAVNMKRVRLGLAPFAVLRHGQRITGL